MAKFINGDIRYFGLAQWIPILLAVRPRQEQCCDFGFRINFLLWYLFKKIIQESSGFQRSLISVHMRDSRRL